MIKFIIARGIAFSPGSVKYIPTFGFIAGEAAAVPYIEANARYASTIDATARYDPAIDATARYG